MFACLAAQCAVHPGMRQKQQGRLALPAVAGCLAMAPLRPVTVCAWECGTSSESSSPGGSELGSRPWMGFVQVQEHLVPRLQVLSRAAACSSVGAQG